jgi:tetratricopeptide (TPR) repeat protein
MKESLAVETLAGRGIDLCRQGNWKRGLEHLAYVAESSERAKLPACFYSYLGYGIARFQGKVDEGLDLCEQALKMDYCGPENHLNLGRIYLLVRGNRGQAFRAIREGLHFDPDNRQLLDVLEEMESRRKPILPFLARGNPVNRNLGRLRHALLAPSGLTN